MPEYTKIPELYDYNQPRVEEYHTPKYEGKDIGLLALFELLNAADWAQTRRISRSPEQYNELPFPSGSSQIIGEHPSSIGVTGLMAANAIGYPLITHALSEPWRTIFQALAIGTKANAVKNNQSIGLDAIRW